MSKDKVNKIKELIHSYIDTREAVQRAKLAEEVRSAEAWKSICHDFKYAVKWLESCGLKPKLSPHGEHDNMLYLDVELIEAVGKRTRTATWVIQINGGPNSVEESMACSLTNHNNDRSVFHPMTSDYLSDWQTHAEAFVDFIRDQVEIANQDIKNKLDELDNKC